MDNESSIDADMMTLTSLGARLRDTASQQPSPKNHSDDPPTTPPVGPTSNEADTQVIHPAAQERQPEVSRGELWGHMFPALWWQIARFNSQADNVALLQCRSSILGACGAQALWYLHAFEGGIASQASGLDARWIYYFMPDVQVDRCIDWRLLLQLNKHACGMPTVIVRIRDIDLTVPISLVAEDTSNQRIPNGDAPSADVLSQVLHQVRRLIHIEWSVEVAETKVFETRWPLRLRQLQWCGRPGYLLNEQASHLISEGVGDACLHAIARGNRELLSGGTLLVEWALPDGNWPLPHWLGLVPLEAAAARASSQARVADVGQRSPQDDSTPFFRDILGRLSRPVGSVSSIGGRRFQISNASLVASSLLEQAEGISDFSTVVRRLEKCNGSILHVDSSLLSQGFWMPIDLGGTVDSLCQDVGQGIAERCPHLTGKIDVRLVARRQFARPLVGVTEKWKSLRQIGWSHDESIRVEPADYIARWRLARAHPRSLGVTAAAAIAASEENGRTILMIVREPSFMEVTPISLDRHNAELEWLASSASPTHPHRVRPWLFEDAIHGSGGMTLCCHDSSGSTNKKSSGRGLTLKRFQRQTSAPAEREDEESLDEFDTEMPWTRSMTEPIRNVFWRRSTSGPAPAESILSDISASVTGTVPAESISGYSVGVISESAGAISEYVGTSSASSSSNSEHGGPNNGATMDFVEGAPSDGAVQSESPHVGELSQEPATNATSTEASSGVATFSNDAPAAGSRAFSRTWKEPILPHYPPTLLPRTINARQFEFHPHLQDLMLVGDKFGNVNVIDVEAETTHPPLSIDNFAVLGLVWMQRHSQTAVCGAAGSGRVALVRFDPQADPWAPALQCVADFKEFPKLTSLSANCSDDFLVATGMSCSVMVYDVGTGTVLHKDNQLHDHFVNTGRFCNSDPHLFCTAAFDHTCKIWDLRQPFGKDCAVRTFSTGGQNVMCVFSPDDRNILCSGVDTRLIQYELPSCRRTPDTFKLREPLHSGRYRRSMYLADSPHIITAATEESHLHVLSVTDGESLGVVDFKGILRRWHGNNGLSGAPSTSTYTQYDTTEQRAGELRSSASAFAGPLRRGLTPSPHRLASRWAQCIPRAPWIRVPQPWRMTRSAAPLQAGITVTDSGVGVPPGRQHDNFDGLSHSPTPTEIVRGELQLHESGPVAATAPGQSGQHPYVRVEGCESVQSMRTHPIIKNRVGVLLCLPQEEQTSCISLFHIDPASIGWQE